MALGPPSACPLLCAVPSAMPQLLSPTQQRLMYRTPPKLVVRSLLLAVAKLVSDLFHLYCYPMLVGTSGSSVNSTSCKQQLCWHVPLLHVLVHENARSAAATVSLLSPSSPATSAVGKANISLPLPQIVRFDVET